MLILQRQLILYNIRHTTSRSFWRLSAPATRGILGGQARGAPSTKEDTAHRWLLHRLSTFSSPSALLRPATPPPRRSIRPRSLRRAGRGAFHLFPTSPSPPFSPLRHGRQLLVRSDRTYTPDTRLRRWRGQKRASSRSSLPRHSLTTTRWIKDQATKHRLRSGGGEGLRCGVHRSAQSRCPQTAPSLPACIDERPSKRCRVIAPTATTQIAVHKQ